MARGTIEQAYQILVSEGYFTTHGAGGTIISAQFNQINKHDQSPILASPDRVASHVKVVNQHIQPFQLGLPALDAFPRKTWARLAGQTLRALDTVAMTYPDPTGYEPLRHMIATYLGISRGIVCSAEQVFITAGYSGTLQLICDTLLQKGDTGWYEDPGYILARDFLKHAGMRLQPVPVDEEGLNVDKGKQLAMNARFAVVTPTHQSPLGVTLSLSRRLELLDWAGEQNAWIIEDDYDSEFRYHGRPVPALKSLDREGCVLYTGTFSKVLFPGLRIAYLVVPPSKIQQFQNSANHFRGFSPILHQATIASFMQQGHFNRHLRRMRSLYATRHQYLIDALSPLKNDLYVQPQVGGIHILAKLNPHINDIAIANIAQSQRLGIQALSNWQINSQTQKGLIMGFTNFITADDAMTAVMQLTDIIRKF